MFRGELGGKINEDLKDGRKKPVDSSGYKKPEILEEKEFGEESIEKISDLSFAKEIMKKTFNYLNNLKNTEKEKEVSQDVEIADKQNVEGNTLEEIDKKIEELKVEKPRRTNNRGVFYNSTISKENSAFYVGIKFAWKEVWSQDGGEVYFIGQNGQPEAYFDKPSEEDVKNNVSGLYVNITNFVKPISEFDFTKDEQYQKNINNENLKNELKELKVEKQKQEIIEFLKKEKILEEKEGFKIWDLEKFSDLRFNKRENKNIVLRSKSLFIENIKDEEGVSKEDFESAKDKNKLKIKKLVYLPENYKKAFDLEYIKRDDWLMDVNQISSKMQHDYSNEIVLDSGEKITAAELIITRDLFGKFNLVRDEKTGILYKINEKTGEKKKFSVWSLRKENTNLPTKFLEHPLPFIKRNTKNLFKSGLLRENDFQLKKGSPVTFRKEWSLHQRTGQIYIEGANYILGKENAGKKIVKLDKNLVGILEQKTNGKNEIVRILNLKSEEEKESKAAMIKEEMTRENIKNIKEKSYIKSRIIFGKEECEVFDYEPVSFNKRFENESESDYIKRMNSLADFNFINDVTMEISRETDISINSELNWKEQQWLATAANESEEQKNKIVEEAKKYGPNFLRAFLSCEQGLKDGQKIIFMAEKLKPEVVQKVFDKYSEIVLKVEEIAKTIPQIANEENIEKTQNLVEENLLKRARELLLKYAKDIGKKENSEEKAVFELNNCEADTVLLAAIYKKSGVKLENVKDITLQSEEQKEIKDDEKVQMLTLVMKNSQNREFDDKVVLHSLQEALKNSKNKFYLLKNKDKIVSFLRLEEMEGKSLYFGSFNTDIDAQGAGLGNSFMERTLDEVSKDHVIKANVEVENPVAQNYVNQRNFVITNILRDVANTKVDGFDIMRDENKAKEVLKTKEYTNKEEFFAEAQDRLKSGEVITGYVLPTKNNPVFKITYGKLIEKTNQV